jgi:hypothetical protein
MASSCGVQIGRIFHRFDDFHIAGAAADIAAQSFADFIVGRAGITSQQSRRRHDESRRAITALRTKLLVKAALHRREPAAAHERFDRIDAPAVDARSQCQTRKARLIVDQNSASATLAAIATGFRSGQADEFPQIVQQ